MTPEELKAQLYDFIKPSYPNIKIEIQINADQTKHITFTEQQFEVLYPRQRYHYLIHLIPAPFFNEHLKDTYWYELAPGEKIENLDYHDDETLDQIKDLIMGIIDEKTPFVARLDQSLLDPKSKGCHGDFRMSKEILGALSFDEKEQFDILHVLMNEGAYCDCEILYNVFKESEYAKNYWRKRAQNYSERINKTTTTNSIPLNHKCSKK